jgi:hypothetical protein
MHMVKAPPPSNPSAHDIMARCLLPAWAQNGEELTVAYGEHYWTPLQRLEALLSEHKRMIRLVASVMGVAGPGAGPGAAR